MSSEVAGVAAAAVERRDLGFDDDWPEVVVPFLKTKQPWWDVEED